ncbi:MAG: lipopolysaccharide biosynthesis protein [Chitinophagaceae bacterium]
MAIPALFKKLNNKHFFSLAGNVIMSGLSLVVMGLLYRCLPTAADMGNWVFFQTVFVLVDMFRTGFLSMAFVKFYAGTQKERADEVLGSTWVLAVYITIGLILLNIPAYWLSHYVKIEGLSFFLKWFGVCYICSLPMFIANLKLQADARFDQLLYMRMVNQLSFLIFIAALIITKHLTLETLVYSYLLSLMIASLFVLLKGWTNISTWKFKSKKSIIELYHFGKFSVLGNISSYLLRGSDVFIIGGMLGAEAVATYNIGLKLMEVIEIPLRSFIATATQSLSALYNRGLKGDMMYVLKKYAGLLTLALIPVCIGSVIFAEFAVYLAGGKKYLHTPLAAQAANIIRLFMTFSLLFPTDRFIALGLDVIHKPNINFMKILVMLGINIATDIAGIQIFGNAGGVALATVFPVIAGIWIGHHYLSKYEPFSLRQIISVGYLELKILLREKLKLKRSFLP